MNAVAFRRITADGEASHILPGKKGLCLLIRKGQASAPPPGEDEVPGTLIIGYGNPMRGDDAIGCHAARALEQHFWNDPDVEVIAAQQLTPEMVDDILQRDFVLFLDASFGEQPGTIMRVTVSPEPGPGGFSHHLTPSSLLTAAEQLYGDTPFAMSITMAGWSFELGQKMSQIANRRMPDLIRLAQEAVEAHRHRAQARTPTGIR
jgi:hydrogenase maturation protease